MNTEKESPTSNVVQSGNNQQSPPPAFIEHSAQTISATPSFFPMSDLSSRGRFLRGGKFVPTFFGLIVLLVGVVSGIYLVRETQNLQQKAANEGLGCTQTSTITYHNFSSCSGTIGVIKDTAACSNVEAALYYCPNGLVNNLCLQNKQLIGPFNRGQRFDITDYTADKTCGVFQANLFNTTGMEGGCGEITYTVGQPCSP